MQLGKLVAMLSCIVLSACDCSKYGSAYSCSYVESRADYEVWYWRHLERDDPRDNVMIGHAIGVQGCEDNARAFAAAVGETFQDRAYICVLMIDGKPMEKHRNLASTEQ